MHMMEIGSKYLSTRALLRKVKNALLLEIVAVLLGDVDWRSRTEENMPLDGLLRMRADINDGCGPRLLPL